jgi:hypothetical protein
MRREVRLHYEAGLAAYAAKDYVAARRELEAAYVLEARPEILFALAQAARQQGDCAAAREHFERFVATGPPETQVQAARLAMSRCQEAPRVDTTDATVAPKGASEGAADATVAAKDVVGPRVAAALPAAVLRPHSKAASAPRARWYADRWAPAFVASGLLLGGVGASLTDAASDDVRGARAATYAEYAGSYAAAERKQRLGVAALIVGAVGVVAGLGRYLHLAIEPDGPSGNVTHVTLGGRF